MTTAPLLLKSLARRGFRLLRRAQINTLQTTQLVFSNPRLPLATSSSETIPEKLDTTGETTLEAECEHTESIPSPGKLKPLFQSLFRENTSELLNDAPLRQPTKRRKLDEIDALYQPALERVEALKTHLLQSQACDKSVAALIDRLESDNERLRTDLDASRQQANSSSQLEAEIKKLTSDHAKLKTELGDSQAKVKHQTKKIKTLMGKNTDLQAQVKSLQSTNQDLTFELAEAKADLREMNGTLSKEKNALRENLATAELEVDALRGLAEMFVSGVNITGLLMQIKAGAQFDEALQASMRKRSDA